MINTFDNIKEQIQNNIDDIKLAIPKSQFQPNVVSFKTFKSLESLIEEKKRVLDIPINHHLRIQNQNQMDNYFSRKGVDLEEIQKEIRSTKYLIQKSIEESKNSFTSVFSVSKMNYQNIDQYLQKFQDYALYAQVFAINKQLTISKNSLGNQINIKNHNSNIIQPQNDQFRQNLFNKLINKKKNQKQQDIFQENQIKFGGFGIQTTENQNILQYKRESYSKLIKGYISSKNLQEIKNDQPEHDFNQPSLFTLQKLCQEISHISVQINGQIHQNLEPFENQSQGLSAKIFNILAQIVEDNENVKLQLENKSNAMNLELEVEENKQKNHQQQKVYKAYLIDRCAQILEDEYAYTYEDSLRIENINQHLIDYFGQYYDNNKFQRFQENWYRAQTERGDYFVWAILFCWYRAGQYGKMQEFLQENSDIKVLDYFSKKVFPKIRDNDSFSKSERQDIIQSLNKNPANQEENDTYDPFKRQLFYLVAKWEKFENQIFVENDNDYLWIMLRICYTYVEEDEKDLDDNQTDMNTLNLYDIQNNILEGYEQIQNNIDKYLLSLNFYQTYQILKQPSLYQVNNQEDLGHYILICKEAGFFCPELIYSITSQNHLNQNFQDEHLIKNEIEARNNEIDNYLQFFLENKFKNQGIIDGITYCMMSYGEDLKKMAHVAAQKMVVTDQVDKFYELLNDDYQNTALYQIINEQRVATMILDEIEKQCSDKEVYKVYQIKSMFQNKNWQGLFTRLQKIFNSVIVNDGRCFIDTNDLEELLNFCHIHIFNASFRQNYNDELTYNLKPQYQVTNFLFQLTQFCVLTKLSDDQKFKIIQEIMELFQIYDQSKNLEMYQQTVKQNCSESFFIFFATYAVFIQNYQEKLRRSIQSIDQFTIQNKINQLYSDFEAIKRYFENVYVEKQQEIQGTQNAKYIQKINSCFINTVQKFQYVF
ncbi:hypothetical protein PPERSA_04142 [Pseudocohnilembus persalinus]|uniref:Uncharacterized protein n=1 Tax=Pseudocohnilembus persalinus TaxID=266149 RepID=A0A0V0QMY3_PSEPJ|nr:hypothetical protein PPERSA_04142 [Pseudocohnilembus persalinus]|eukprot:KRX03590.1 hypothetical protein PPERSA_04142 [Pseudocohnilembus persalinus]